MRYLKKKPDSTIVSRGWRYPQDARQIRDELLREQRGFCAYSERFVHAIDSCDVEHFDPRLKTTDRDGYWNWYAVLHWVNSHKPRKIDPYLPMLPPHDPDVSRRIRYEDGQFVAEDGDAPAENLIKYLGWNRPELAEDRSRHVRRIRELRSLFGEDADGFRDFLRLHRENLSFATALEVELGRDLSGLI